MTQTGTTCPTAAEDAIKAAYAQSAAWQGLTETTTSEEAAATIYIDYAPLPPDGHVFDLGDLMERRVSMMILINPEEGITIAPGDAQGVIDYQSNHDIVVERWVRDSEKSDETTNQKRKLLEAMYTASMEAVEWLLANKGPRFLSEALKIMPPVENHYKEEEMMGRWQQVTIKAVTGTIGDGGGN